MASAPHTSIYGWIFTDGVINLTPADLSEDVKNSRVFAFIVPPFCVAQQANKANKEKIQWYNLPVIDGLTPYENSGGSIWQCGYCKDNLGFVHVCAKFKTSSQIKFSDVTIIATLPEGYRPKNVFSAACALRYSGNGGQTLYSYLDFWPYGAVALYTTNQDPAPSQLFIPPVSFLAENNASAAQAKRE